MKIVAAAIVYEGVLYTVPPPGRHHNIIRLIAEWTGVEENIRGKQGFVTDCGKFVDRLTAMEIAVAANQLKEGIPVLKQLYSENLW